MLPLLPTDGRQATGVLPRVTRNATMNHSQPNCAFNHKTTHDLIPRLVYADPARLPFPCSTKVVLNFGVLQPLDRVLGAGRHLLALINDILDLSKIEAGRMELQLEPFALAPLIAHVVKTIEPMTAKNGNRVIIDCPANLGTIHADQTRFRQSLLNLASNANKFTEKGTVTIATHQAHENGCDWITLAVTDTGIAD